MGRRLTTACDGDPVDGLGGYIDHAEISIDREHGVPTVTLSGPDDMTVLADRLTYPNPATNAAARGTPAYDQRTGVASTVILAYIAWNAGHLALSSRITPNFNTNIADPNIDIEVSGKARFDVLLDVVARSPNRPDSPSPSPRPPPACARSGSPQSSTAPPRRGSRSRCATSKA